MRVLVTIGNVRFPMPNFGVIDTEEKLMMLVEMGAGPFYRVRDFGKVPSEFYSVTNSSIMSIDETPFSITSEPYKTTSGFLFCRSVKHYGNRDFEDGFSLGDYNIDDGHWNDNHIFVNESCARSYLVHIQTGGNKLPRGRYVRGMINKKLDYDEY